LLNIVKSSIAAIGYPVNREKLVRKQMIRGVSRFLLFSAILILVKKSLMSAVRVPEVCGEVPQGYSTGL